MRVVCRWIIVAPILAISVSALSAQEGLAEGIVRTPNGQGISGATISLRHLSVPGVIVGATSDSQGAFRISGMVPGSYSLIAEKAGYASDDRVRSAGDPNVVIHAGETTLVVIYLVPQAVVGGRITVSFR